MFIKIKYSLDIRNVPKLRAVVCSLTIMLISVEIINLYDQIDNCRKIIFSLSSTNMTSNSSSLQCDIPYEECRCSVTSHKYSNAIQCITDIQAMAADISPLVLYLLQLYIIYVLFSFTGKYSHILTDIFWVIALFVFIIIAITVHGGTCLYYKTSWTLILSGHFLLVMAVYLYVRSTMKYSSRRRRKMYRKRRLEKNNNNCEILAIVTVS
jgi:hypothetical protein